MSYDIYLLEPGTDRRVVFDEPNYLTGGTYCMGGTNEAWLNVTYNYGRLYYAIMGEGGIRSIYGKTGEESIAILSDAIAKLGDDRTDNYWDATEGNAKEALKNLRILAARAPHGIWDGD